MIISQLLLLLFMANWLRSEYRGEVQKLSKELSARMSKAEGAITDSLIMTELVQPIIAFAEADTDNHAIRRIIRRDTVLGASVTIEAQSTLNGSGRKRVNEKNFTYTREKVPVDVFRRGVRMMVNTSDTIFQGIEQAMMEMDTTALSAAFRKNIRTAGLPFSAKWVPKSAANGDGIFIESYTPRYSVQIGAYRNYVLRQMLPQVAITLVLLSLTGLAFFITYKSLRAQTRLAAIRNDFISNMSHELKTPVSTVKVALEAISEPEVLADTATAKDYIRMAALEIARLELLINQSLQTSLLEEGRVAMVPAPVDLSALVSELVQVMQPRFTQSGAVLRTSVSGQNFVVAADRLQIQGVVLNILDNSLKYAGPSPLVHIHTESRPDGIAIGITDNGPGIPAEYRGRIFEKFFRVPRGNEHSVKGYGLGLSYAAQVMKAHGGGISMERSAEGGCTFILRFKKDPA
jgi:two-component system phosphate regulon sensor histidine kinase PhoR